MIWKLSRFAILFFLCCILFGFSDNKSDNKSANFFDIFSPDNLNLDSVSNDKKKAEIVQAFTVYGIINSKKVQKVFIKPKIRNLETKKLLNSRGYIVLALGDKFHNYQLIKIEKDTAIFKNNEKIVKLSVFNEEKKDRPISNVKSSGPKIITENPTVLPAKTNNIKKVNNKKKNGFTVINKNKKPVIHKKPSKNIHKNKSISFFELIKKAKKNRQNGNKPVENPFLKLFQHK